MQVSDTAANKQATSVVEAKQAAGEEAAVREAAVEEPVVLVEVDPQSQVEVVAVESADLPPTSTTTSSSTSSTSTTPASLSDVDLEQASTEGNYQLKEDFIIVDNGVTQSAPANLTEFKMDFEVSRY